MQSIAVTQSAVKRTPPGSKLNGHAREYSQNGGAPNHETLDPEIELLALMRHCKGTIAPICEADVLTRPDFADPVAGALFGAAAFATHDLGTVTHHDVRKMLDAWTRENSEIAPLAVAGLQLWDRLEKSDIAPDDPKAHALKLAQEIKKRAASTRALRFPRIGLAEVFARPRLEYLIQDVLLERGTGVLSADYGAYKSFLALSMCFCVATGMEWHGRKTKRGTVVYIIAEGAYTTADRARAFLIRHQIEAPENFHLIEMPVQIGDAAQCSALIEELSELKPALVIFDTLAKCNLGRDENDTTEMTLFTHGMDRISSALNAMVLAIHHNNKGGTTRGAIALPANVDTHIVLKPKGQRIVTVECDKQKGAPFESFALVGRVVELPEVDEYGRQVTSLVFDSTEAPPTPPSKSDESLEKVFRVLAAHPPGLKASEWQEQSGLSASRFYDLRDILKEKGRISQDGRIYKVTPITPITPNRSESEREINSDYSDDPLGSE
jgi:hypothetical protein